MIGENAVYIVYTETLSHSRIWSNFDQDKPTSTTAKQIQNLTSIRTQIWENINHNLHAEIINLKSSLGFYTGITLIL